MTNEEWKRENTIRFNMRFTELSGVPEALRKMTEVTGKTASEYIREVVTAKLKADGYLPEK